MAEQRKHWGTQAILDAPVRETEGALVTEVRDTHGRKSLELKRLEGSQQVRLNGHPFQSAAQCISAIARKFAMMEAQVQSSNGDGLTELDRVMLATLVEEADPGRFGSGIYLEQVLEKLKV